MGAWVDVADSLRLCRAESKFPDREVLKGFEKQIWKNRLHPPPEEVEDLCAHIDGVHKFVRLQGLKV